MNLDTISLIAGAVITIAAVLLGVRWQLAKNKLSEIRKLIDAVDDALRDDSISEEEFREIFQRLMKVVKS
jgi:hypothetical protein